MLLIYFLQLIIFGLQLYLYRLICVMHWAQNKEYKYKKKKKRKRKRPPISKQKTIYSLSVQCNLPRSQPLEGFLVP